MLVHNLLNQLFFQKHLKKVNEIIINTGQHYDVNMSDLLFKELNLKVPSYNLEVGSGLLGEQTSIMLSKIEKILIAEKPDVVIVYRDTNSTIAGALAAAKIHIPIAHIDAGLRSFNKKCQKKLTELLQVIFQLIYLFLRKILFLIYEEKDLRLKKYLILVM